MRTPIVTEFSRNFSVSCNDSAVIPHRSVTFILSIFNIESSFVFER